MVKSIEIDRKCASPKSVLFRIRFVFRSFTNLVLPFLTSLFVVFAFRPMGTIFVCYCSLAGVFYYLAKKADYY